MGQAKRAMALGSSYGEEPRCKLGSNNRHMGSNYEDQNKTFGGTKKMKRSRMTPCGAACTLMLALVVAMLVIVFSNAAHASPPEERAKFYDFSDQLIDGEIRRPTALYTDARDRAKFERLLRLKKSFLPDLFETSQERTFK